MKKKPTDLTPMPEVIPAEVMPTRQAHSVPSVVNELGLLSHYTALPATEGAGVMTTLDLSHPGNVVKLQHAISGESVSLWDLRPEEVIEVTDIVAHYSERTDEETGETTSGPMLTLIGPLGHWHTGSQFAFRALQMIALLRGRPPWNPPIRVRAIHCRSRNKRDFQSVVLTE